VLNVGLWAPWKNQAEALEIARKYPHMDFWFVGNQAPNFKHYWEPLMQDVPSNVTIWGERSDVSEFMKKADIFMFNSTWECNPLVLREAISYGLPVVARNLPQYENMFARYLHPIDTNLNLLEFNTYTIPTDNTIQTFGNNHVELYKNVKNMDVRMQNPEKITIFKYFVLNPFLEIRGVSDSDFKVEFYDESDVCVYSNIIKANSWVKLNRSYFTKWHVKVWENDVLIHDEWLNYENKRVYIAFDSKSLGDTIAWMPYVEEFKKKHNCHVIVSTHKNWLFKDVYPEIEFVEPGSVVNNIMGMYKIGWFYNSDAEPVLANTIPLQQAATNILGLEYKEIKPRIAFTPGENLYGKYVTIATNSTAGCKFWTKEGWQAVITYLTNKGYRVINVSKERNPFNGVMQIPEDLPMSEVMSIIHHSEFFIGLSSGLSWLAWALDKQVVMISNFTEDNHEFDCIRVTKKNVCHGCWNSPEHTFDKGDWDWCPLHKGTPRQFECHTSITAQDVISSLPLARS
jgi:autotransporter strand-loop-strand O-heptosyltransferase